MSGRMHHDRADTGLNFLAILFAHQPVLARESSKISAVRVAPALETPADMTSKRESRLRTPPALSPGSHRKPKPASAEDPRSWLRRERRAHQQRRTNRPRSPK